jgi:copper chaperone
MKTVNYNVSGLVNSESKTKLRNSLDKIEGVRRTSIDPNLGMVEVQFNEPASEEIIKSCIENTGYNVE